jgi:type I restriction-modification system DNA methylase subunit
VGSAGQALDEPTAAGNGADFARVSSGRSRIVDISDAIGSDPRRVMANEELLQRGYVATGKLKGGSFGEFEELNIGSTSVAELVSAGLSITVPTTIDFKFKAYKAPKKAAAAKPDRLFLRRSGSSLVPVAVAEYKAPKKRSDAQLLVASEQSLYSSIALGVRVAITTNGERWKYIDVEASVAKGEIVYFHNESRDLNPAVLQNLLAGDAGVVKDPKPLAETVWQIIWHATKEEPKQCLLTFIEIFVLKFLSDNLPTSALPEANRFYELLLDPVDFERKHGVTAIEYYVSAIRPQIKRLFPDKVVVQDTDLPKLFGLKTLVSGTSVINGFAFLKTSDHTTVASYNRTFREILEAFHAFGPLTTIDPEFKLRLYETFLKRSARQQKLGQFFTPRNIVRPMIRMAQLGKLPDGAVVLDPAAGVGGFILEPMLIADALPDNVRFEKGRALRRVKTIGVDVDANTHILGKANMLLHLAEAVRDPTVTIAALNQAMAETFVLMNSNETLGALENPVRDGADVILTNPPYVTQGSRIYRDEIASVSGTKNGLDLRDYYANCGLGVESIFMRYISGALKPGGRAFVIVPLGYMNRTEPGPKERLLRECNVLASIALPRGAFFNTAQPTCILVLERRHTEVDSRPNVFCAMIRSIGETLDYQRIQTPDKNDLEDVASLFVDRESGGHKSTNSPLVKIVAADRFGKDDRWDVARFWSEDELVQLGFRESAVERVAFIDDASEQLTALVADLAAARRELSELTAGDMVAVSLSEASMFTVRSGERVRNEDIRANPGDVPVYSCFTEAKSKKGDIDAAWLEAKKIPIESNPLVTIMANGASAIGRVFVRRERCAITDDVIIVECLHRDIDVDFLAIQLRSEIARGNFVYEAKLFAGRVRLLSVNIPVLASGRYDKLQQMAIASAVNRFDRIREQLLQLGEWSRDARIM